MAIVVEGIMTLGGVGEALVGGGTMLEGTEEGVGREGEGLNLGDCEKEDSGMEVCRRGNGREGRGYLRGGVVEDTMVEEVGGGAGIE